MNLRPFSSSALLPLYFQPLALVSEHRCGKVSAIPTNPAINPPVSSQKARLVEPLEDLFQLNQPELDFGRYRIVHARSKEIRAFMQTELATEIDAAFAGQASQTAHSTLQAARRKVLDNLDDDAFDATGDLEPEHHATKLDPEFLAAQQQARKDGGPLANDA